MKTLLLLALFTFSIQALAQHTPVRNLPKEMNANSIHQKNRQHESTQYPATFITAIQGGQNSNHSSRDLFGLIQVFDSIHQFIWDTLTYDWQLDFQYTNLTYNGDNYLTSLTRQDRVGSTWSNNFQVNYIYDGNNNEIGRHYKIWDGLAWINDYQILFTYDGNNLQTSEVQQIWAGNSWQNYFQYLFTYNSNYNLITDISQSWDGTSWMNISKYTYNYDNHDNLTKYLSQEWEDVNAVWINSNQRIYTYDANNNQLTSTFQVWNGLNFDNSGLTTYMYDVNNRPIDQLTQIWDGTQWRNATHITLSYTGDDLTYVFSQDWNGSNWENSFRINYTYNGNHQWTKSLYDIWDGNTWLKATQSLRSYGEDDFISGASSIYFDNEGQLIIGGDSTHNFFKTAVGIEHVDDDNGNFTIYPNPSSGRFTISAKTEIGDVKIYSPLGALVFYQKEVSKQSLEINLNGFPKGIYLVILGEGANTFKHQVVFQ